MTFSPQLLEVRDLVVERGGSTVLRIDNFDLHANETIALIGPNGTGKTSLLLAIAGLIEKTSGQILLGGVEIPSGSGASVYRRRLAMVFQEPLLFDATVADNVAAGLKIRGMSRAAIRERLGECLERFRISHLADRAARKLSGGEAQRTSLARAFATNPELLLLDEPFSSLDPPTRQAMTDDLAQILRESGTAAIITTHDREEALRLADRMVVMQDGTIIQSGTPASVINNPVNAFAASFVGMENTFSGTVTAAGNGLLTLNVEGQVVEIPGDGHIGERVVLCIHPEHVAVNLSPPNLTSSRNVYSGCISRIVPCGLFNKVYLDCGFTLVATITSQSLRQLGLQPTASIHASFKATSVHLFRKS